MATINDLVTSALRELGIVDVTATPPAELSALALGQINRILDEWNAKRGAIYADTFTAPAALVAGTNPHTIGPSGATLSASPSRPVSIEGIRLTTDNGETYLPPLTSRDAAWWHGLANPGTQSDYPTDFYYDATWPNGAIYFFPEPGSSSVKVSIWSRVVLASVVLSDTFTMPPGYHSALLETLKERLTALPMFASMSTPDIKEAARRARGDAFGNNETIHRMMTADSGLAGCGHGGVYRSELGPFSLMRR